MKGTIVALAHRRVEIDQLHQRICAKTANPIIEVVEGELEFLAVDQLHDAAAHEDRWMRDQHGSLTGTPSRANSVLSSRALEMPK